MDGSSRWPARLKLKQLEGFRGEGAECPAGARAGWLEATIVWPGDATARAQKEAHRLAIS